MDHNVNNIHEGGVPGTPKRLVKDRDRENLVFDKELRGNQERERGGEGGVMSAHEEEKEEGRLAL